MNLPIQEVTSDHADREARARVLHQVAIFGAGMFAGAALFAAVCAAVVFN